MQGIEDTIQRPMPRLDLVAHTMLALLEGAMLRQRTDPEGTDLDALFAEFRRTVILGLDSRLPPDQRLGLDALELP